MDTRHCSTARFLFVCLLFTVSAFSVDAQTNDPYELHIVMRNALAHGGEQSSNSPPLLIDLSRRDGTWWPVRGYAITFNQGSHMGVVITSDVSEASIKLDVLMKIGGDQWVKGGFGRYAITLSGKDANGQMTGTYEGTFRDAPFKGEAYGTVKPPRPIRVPNFKPLEKGEHPRILFRKADLPKFHEKLKTRLGQDTIALFKTMPGNHVALAFLYAATGEKQYAEKALPLIEREMQKYDRGAFAVDDWHARPNSIGLACDLIWDTLPPDFLQKLYEYADRIGDSVCNNLGIFGSGFNFNPCSNWYGPVVGTGGTLSLLLYGELGPEPQKPMDMLGAATGPGNDAIGKMVSKYTDAAKATAAANELAWKKTFWETEHAVWKQTGWDMRYAFLFDQVVYQNYKHLRFGIGDGGFQSEVGGYAMLAHHPPLWFAAQYRQITGRDISPYPDATHFNVRHMMAEWYGENGQSHAMPINGAAGVLIPHVATQFAIAPDEWKPALLWVWNFKTGVKYGDETTYINAIKGAGGSFLGCMGQAQGFVNYPLDMKPVHPKEVMPRTWQAPTRGMYVFRSGWEGKDEFICQTFVKATPIGGNSQANAGSFKIWGLQKEWITGHDGKKDVRQNLPVVDLPDNESDSGVNLAGCGILADLRTETDGSGGITIDLNEVYGRGAVVKVEKVPEPVEDTSGKMLTARQLRARIKQEKPTTYRKSIGMDANFVRVVDPQFDPDRMKGLRAFAFDYSGKAGVPCVAVAVDHIEGGKRKIWRIPPPPGGSRDAPGPAVVFTNNGFTVRHSDGASMQAVFVSPSDVVASLETDEIDKSHKQELKDTIKSTAIKVSGPTGEEGDFFVVMTFTRGEHPKVTREGTGRNTKVTVGERKIRFDGTRVVME